MSPAVPPPYLQSVLALRPPLATSTRTDLAPSFKLLYSTVNSIYGLSGLGLEPGLWRAQLIRITLRSAQLIEAVWTKLGGQGGVIVDDQLQGGRGVMKMQSVFSDLQMFVASLTTLQDPLSTILLDQAAFSRTQATVASLSKKLIALVQHYKVEEILPTPLDRWPEEDTEDKDQDFAALPVLIAKSRPNKAVLQIFQDTFAQHDQSELSSSTNVLAADQDAQGSLNPLASSTSSATPSLHSSSYAQPGLSTANRSDFLRFVYSQNPNLIGHKRNLDTAVAAGTAALSSMTSSSKAGYQPLSKSPDGRRSRKSLVQQRISSFATSDSPPPLPGSILNQFNAPRRVASDTPNNHVARKSWKVDMSGLNGIQRQASLSSSKPSSHPAPSAQILVAVPPVSWKSSSSRPASLKSRSSSITEAPSYSRSSTAEASDLKRQPTGPIPEQTTNPVEHGDAATSAELESSLKSLPAATFAEQAAAIVAARKQRAISQSSSSSILSRERHFPLKKGDLNVSNGRSTNLTRSISNDTNSVSEPSDTGIPPLAPEILPTPTSPSSQSVFVSEQAPSSSSNMSSGSSSGSLSSSTTASVDMTIMPAVDTAVTPPVDTAVADTSSSSSSPSSAGSSTTYSKVDLMSPSTTTAVRSSSGSSVSSILSPDHLKKSLKTSTSTYNASNSHSSPTSPIPMSSYGPSAALSEPDSDLERVPDLIEHVSLLDVILAPTDVSFIDSSKKPSEPVESTHTSPTPDPVSPSSLPSRSYDFLNRSSNQTNALPADELSLADLMEQASMFEDWTPDQEQAVQTGRGSTSSLSSTVHPEAHNEPESMRMLRIATSTLLHRRGSTPLSPLDSLESPSEMMRSLSATSPSPVSPKPSSKSLRPIDSVLTCLTEGNQSSALLSLAGSTSSSPSASGNSWATSFLSNSPMAPDLDWNFLNGNYDRDQLFIPPSSNPLRSGWRILCLDGGGVRGLSMLYLVRELMLSIQSHMQLERTPLPCEIFEIICGVGTGGIIALLLGRLRLDVSIAIPAYLQVIRQVFGHSKGVMAAVRRTTRFSASRLEAVIQQVVDRISGNPELPLADEETGTGCRTFVISTRPSENKGERDSFIKLRSYSHKPMVADTCNIAQAARATSAAPLFFKPLKLDDRDNRTDLVPTDTTVNNPSLEAISEAHTLFPARPIDCLVSLGAGIGLAPGSGSIARACAEMSESCERTAREVEAKSQREGWSDNYIRLSAKGLKNEDNRGEWQNPDSIKAGTARYIFLQEQDKFHQHVKILSNSWKGACECLSFFNTTVYATPDGGEANRSRYELGVFYFPLTPDDDDVFKNLTKVDHTPSITPLSAIFPPGKPISSPEQLRRSFSQVEMHVNPVDKSVRSSKMSQASVSHSSTAPDLQRVATVDLKLSSMEQPHRQHGISVQPHLTDSCSRFSTELKLPEFDFSKV